MSQLLVVGAGISGLSLARALRDTAWQVTVVDQAPDFDVPGVGIVLHPNGLEGLETLGLGDAVRRTGNPVRQLEIVRQGVTRRIALSEVWQSRRGTACVARPDLHALLHASVSDGADNVQVLPGKRLVALDDVERGPVARFADGTDNTFDVVVGADGVHSTVRRLLLPTSEAVSTGLHYTRFVADDVPGLVDDTWQTTERPDVSHGFIPLGAGRAHCFVQLRGGLASEIGTATDSLADRLEQWDPALASVWPRRRSLHQGTAHLVRPIAWGHGAVALVGDASHAVSPTLSQGGSLAIQDSLALARALTTLPIESALKAYEAARQAAVTWAYRMSLSQINSLRRRAVPTWTIDEAEVTTHLRAMYGPLALAE